MALGIVAVLSLVAATEAAGQLHSTVRLHQQSTVRSQPTSNEEEDDVGPAIDLSQKLPSSTVLTSVSQHTSLHQPRRVQPQAAAVIVDAAGDAALQTRQTVRVHSQRVAPVLPHSTQKQVQVESNELKQKRRESAVKPAAHSKQTKLEVESHEWPADSAEALAKPTAAMLHQPTKTTAIVEKEKDSGLQEKRKADPTPKGAEEEGEFVPEKTMAQRLLEHLDIDSDGCVDQSEFANVIMAPMVLKYIKPLADSRSIALPKEIFSESVPKKRRWCPSVSLSTEGEAEACAFGCKRSTVQQDGCYGLLMMQAYFSLNETAPDDGKIRALCAALYYQDGPCVCAAHESIWPYSVMAVGASEAVDDMGKENVDEKLGYYSDIELNPHSHGACGNGWTTNYFHALVEVPLHATDIVKIFNDEHLDSVSGTAYGISLRGFESMFLFFYALVHEGWKESLLSLKTPDHATVEAALFHSADKTGNGKGICVLAWQPTQGWSDWKFNLRGRSVPFGEGVEGKTHEGFQIAYKGLRSKVMKAFENSPCSDPDKVQDIIFTGHGMGGALAAITMADAKKNWNFVQTRKDHLMAITTGAPPVGDKEFCEKNFQDGSLLQFAAEDDDVVFLENIGGRDISKLMTSYLGTYHCSDLLHLPCNAPDCHSLERVYMAYVKDAGDHEKWDHGCERFTNNAEVYVTPSTPQ